jgi:hypothetical protein
MIAPIRQNDDPPRLAGMRRAHRIVASRLLRNQDRPTDVGPPVPAWQAWLLSGWVVLAVLIYAACMIGLL